MNGSLRFVIPITAAGALVAAAPASARAQETIESLSKRVAELEAKLPKGDTSGTTSLGSMFSLYGWLRLDTIWDDSRANNTQVPAYIRSEDPTAPAGFAAKNNSSDLNIHPKLTRIGVNFTGPKLAGLGDATVTGKLETDFYNATATESREALRIRVAYAQLAWSGFSLYAGQMWDVISPLYPVVNPDLVMWGAGNLGDRRPQIRGEWNGAAGDSKVTLTGMVGSTGAIDAQDLDANTYRDGDQSAQPTLQARAGWKTSIFSSKSNLEFGFWVHHANEETDKPIGTNRNFASSVYGIDFQIPVYEDLVWFKGELWHGRNLDDVRGGILQGINSAGDEIRSEGGFAELGFKAGDHTKLHAGWSFDNPNNDDLIVSSTNAPRSRNAVAYAAATWDFKPVSFGLHYLRWTTGYKGFDKGDDNRLQAYVQYSF